MSAWSVSFNLFRSNTQNLDIITRWMRAINWDIVFIICFCARFARVSMYTVVAS
ncbi:hypothetical protein BU23DRAFT_559782 [Bimuria novae-zelandiae CBS 107.79]|uniref:Uncharacterized protein n=1 Tax=Bimuria novae-zelandiae CBS 107.79 TaxID=1447943 RepID=A0A6A5UPZ2_9PLEO|nr:hypothetical protein BU23DRAFT_559782 [Bimuria novae-zelandiae CBS 107.79]